uniref:Uncharacterized protein n=1 Tax=Parascaris equorum TaxID=6256 RepID=A0A914R349_PAREQ
MGRKGEEGVLFFTCFLVESFFEKLGGLREDSRGKIWCEMQYWCAMQLGSNISAVIRAHIIV